jgi:hypothetical protein
MSKQTKIAPVLKRKTDITLASTNNSGEEPLPPNSAGSCTENLIEKNSNGSA